MTSFQCGTLATAFTIVDATVPDDSIPGVRWPPFREMQQG